MPLKYPTVRLFVLNQLMENSLSCGRAFLQGAYEFGVVKAGSLDQWFEAQTENTSCLLLPVARRTLEEFFQGKSGTDLETAWTSFMDQFDEHKSTIPDVKYSSTCGTKEEACGSLAPLALDLMVQQINRY